MNKTRPHVSRMESPIRIPQFSAATQLVWKKPPNAPETEPSVLDFRFDREVAGYLDQKAQESPNTLPMAFRVPWNGPDTPHQLIIDGETVNEFAMDLFKERVRIRQH